MITLALVPVSVPVGGERADACGHGGPAGDAPTAALLLHHGPAEQTGTASGVFNTSRQIGGALGVAVVGAPISGGSGFHHGLRISLVLAADIALLTALATRSLGATRGRGL
ncbi:hypothetical protein [Streptomyces sp. NPDC020377]|uniref:hypothetical protein n=1 Tax=Streptomyces sp. NPDC020377 TaxID=3365070 RepID=UPI00378E383D